MRVIIGGPWTMAVQRQQHHSDTDETGLIARAIRRDEAAIRTLIQRHNRRLYRLARGVVGNDSEAEDVLQDAYLKAFRHLDSFRGESSLSTWLSRIVINEGRARLRRRRPTVTLEALEMQHTTDGHVIQFPSPQAQDHSDPESAMARAQIQHLMEQAIDDLPEAFRTVLIARIIEEMSTEETANLLGLRPETVKTRLFRARKLLREDLERQIGPMITGAFPFGGSHCARLADRVVAALCRPANAS
jgi:RNA polymerase sigma-70 factor (ECF subfamily)